MQFVNFPSKLQKHVYRFSCWHKSGTEIFSGPERPCPSNVARPRLPPLIFEVRAIVAVFEHLSAREANRPPLLTLTLESRSLSIASGKFTPCDKYMDPDGNTAMARRATPIEIARLII